MSNYDTDCGTLNVVALQQEATKYTRLTMYLQASARREIQKGTVEGYIASFLYMMDFWNRNSKLKIMRKHLLKRYGLKPTVRVLNDIVRSMWEGGDFRP